MNMQSKIPANNETGSHADHNHSSAPINDFFKERIDKALGDAELRANFRGAMEFLTTRRAAILPNREDFEALRSRGQQIRNNSLQQLPELLEQFDARCTENGIKVHWAETAEEANQIILGIMQDHQGQLIIKGKSMASEEIGLNHFLEAQGKDALESDMGEYIVQLDQTLPSHIIMPAIHKNKQQIAKLFEEKIGVDYTEDVDQLIGIGRQVLRQKFLEADIGFSGVNFALADSGTLCLVENEGNGRMSTTVPPVHIALCGIEKVISSMTDIPPLLTLLTRSATGQNISTYFNMISGPRKDGELDGPTEVHLVMLDNGRSRIYADKQLQQTLRCIRCGSCMNHCPVYTHIGGHAYGSVYPGPIGQVVEPQLRGLDKAAKLTQACSLNGACHDACPVNIPLPDLIRRLRYEANNDDATSQTPGKGSQRKKVEVFAWTLWALLYTNLFLYKSMLWCATRFRKLTPGKISPWTDYRTAPMPAPRSLHELVKQHQRGSHD
jgi:L-lactate dehydrogenase complex protein LldF